MPALRRSGTGVLETKGELYAKLNKHRASGTEAGKQMAADIGQKLKGIGFDAVFVSDMLRAVQTAEIILEAGGKSGVPIEKDARLREWYDGAEGASDDCPPKDSYLTRGVHVIHRVIAAVPVPVQVPPHRVRCQHPAVRVVIEPRMRKVLPCHRVITVAGKSHVLHEFGQDFRPVLQVPPNTAPRILQHHK